MVIPDWTAAKPPKIEVEQREVEYSSDFLLARPLDRLAANIVDVFVLLVPVYILISAPFKRMMTASFILGAEPDFIAMIACMVCLGVFLVVAYQSLMHYYFSATVGKMLFDLRVKSVFRESRITFFGLVGRSLVWIFEILCLGLPLLSVFSNSKRRSLHDRISDTVVISRAQGSVLSPGHWERGLVRGFFGACILFVLMVSGIEARQLYMKFKSDKGLLSLMDHETSQCEAVSRALEHENGEHSRLDMAMSLYAAGAADRGCLEAELEHEIASHVPVGGITYLAQAFVNSEDTEVSNSYLDQVCEDAPNTIECSMSKVVSRWSEEDWGAVEDLLTSAKKGSGYLEVWAVRHYMKQGHYKEALGFLDTLTSHRELAEFSQIQRVKALFNSYAESEANEALAQALTSLAADEGQDLREWMCAQQLQNGCEALEKLACNGVHPSREIGEIDFERTGEALSKVMALECKGDNSIDYLTFSESVKDEDWQLFFRANLKKQRDDLPAAFKLYSAVMMSPDAPELLRIEALRRASQFADSRDISQLVGMWRGFESRESWIKGGNFLFSKLMQKNERDWAMRVARHLMTAESLAPKSIAALTDMMQAEQLRQPASVSPKKATQNLLKSISDDDGEEK